MHQCPRPDILMFQHLLSNKINLVVCDLASKVCKRMLAPLCSYLSLGCIYQFMLQEHLIDVQRVKICVLKFMNNWVMRNQSHNLQPSVIAEPVAQLSFKGVGCVKEVCAICRVGHLGDGFEIRSNFWICGCCNNWQSGFSWCILLSMSSLSTEKRRHLELMIVL